jgi:hypothetical protein
MTALHMATRAKKELETCKKFETRSGMVKQVKLRQTERKEIEYELYGRKVEAVCA